MAIISTCFSLAIVLAVAMTAYRALSQDFETTLIEQQTYQAERVSSQVSQSLQMRLSMLEAFGTSLTDGENLLSQKRLEQLLGRQSALTALFSNGLLILDRQTTAIAEDTFVPNRIGTNYADRDHFKQAIRTRQPVISKPIIGRTTGVPLLSFVAPIQSDAGDLLGFISGSIDLNETNLIPPDALRMSRRQKAELLVIDTQNFLYVESPEHRAIGDIQPLPNPGESPLIDAAMSGLGLGEVTAESGDPLIFATSHLERLGWLFIRVVPKELAKAPAIDSFNRFLVASLLIVCLMVPLTYLVTHSAMRPLDRMTQRIRTMSSAGTTSARVEETGPPEVRNLAQAFNRLQDERDATIRMQDDFISNVSHELRTPLTSLNGALKLISSGTLGSVPDKVAEMIARALRNGQRLQLLISDLLDFNKLNAGEMQLTMKAQPLAPIVTQAIHENQTTAQVRKVTLVAHCDSGLNMATDAHRLRQILDNFISNAIKHSPPGGQVRLEATEKEENRIRLTVTDQGDGVPENFHAHLFHRFSQAEAGTKRASKGTGLGLAICRELATLMNGQIGAYNDHGAHFWVEFPVEKTGGSKE
ncbi:sensor histidine kinase [Marinobacter confluentis]|uniref:histidine kinase n=1 Tax=Marinobacter confluentis TaxID=1697557 RepID=A0A4Z1CFV2_9GAMM|nr:sensor histidine kinase [Marinobacter confluentis]